LKDGQKHIPVVQFIDRRKRKMSEKNCVACTRTINPLQYANKEAGILLCQTCVQKISKHYIKGVIAEMEANYNAAQSLKFLVRRIERKLKVYQEVNKTKQEVKT